MNDDNKKIKKVMIMAGGTGGHIFPGIAIGNSLIKHNIEIIWLGSKGGMEADIIPKANFKLYLLNIRGFRQKSFLKKMISPFLFIYAIFQAIRFLNNEKPDRVLGMGGFASAPGGIAAWILRIPLYIHEQNSIPGLSNKLLSFIAQKVFCGFPQTFKKQSYQNSNKFIFTGNPVREDILNISPKIHLHHPVRLLIIGGSRGAKILNDTLPLTIPLLSQNFSLEIYHQTGSTSTTNYPQENENFHVTTSSFIDDMAKIYDWADIIICRSGALTLAELTAVGIPAVLIPYPYAVDDHQTENVKYLLQHEACILIPQSELTPENLAEQLQHCMETENYMKMASASRALRKDDTVNIITGFF